MLKEITVEITQQCLNNCLFCSSLASANCKHLSLSDIAFVLKQCENVQSLSLSGGEPLLHPDILEILQLASSFNTKYIYTSGVYKKISPIPVALLDKIKDNQFILVFNIQSTNEVVHDKLIGANGRLKIALKSLQRAIQLGITTECHIVPNKQNLDTLATTTVDLINLGVSRVSFLSFVPQGRGEENRNELLTNKDVLSKEFAKLKLYSSKIRFGMPLSGQAACTAGISKLVLKYDNTFVPCEAFKCTNMTIGKIGDSLEVIMEKASHYMKSIKNTEACPAHRFWNS